MLLVVAREWKSSKPESQPETTPGGQLRDDFLVISNRSTSASISARSPPLEPVTVYTPNHMFAYEELWPISTPIAAEMIAGWSALLDNFAKQLNG